MKQRKSKWTLDLLIIEAARYTMLRDFTAGSTRAYRVAVKHPKKALIMGHLNRVAKKWTLELLMIESSKYQHRFDFQIGSKGAYQESYRRPDFELIVAHMTPKRPPAPVKIKRKAMTFQQVEAVAASCKTKAQWIRHSAEYAFAGRIGYGYLQSISEHMIDGRKAA